MRTGEGDIGLSGLLSNVSCWFCLTCGLTYHLAVVFGSLYALHCCSDQITTLTTSDGQMADNSSMEGTFMGIVKREVSSWYLIPHLLLGGLRNSQGDVRYQGLF